MKLLFIFILGWISCMLNANDLVAQSTKRPNIILIVSDDHAYQAISAYNSKWLSTPNIDRIGRQGAIMDRAYVTNSVCSPSRAVIITGKYSHQNGLVDNGTFFDSSQQTFPKILQAAGYRTAVIGKWHLWSEPTGFDYWNVLPDQGHYYNPGFIKMGKDTTYKGYVSDVITDLSLDWIEQNRKSPFCLLLFHKAPHRNWMPPLRYLDRFSDKTFELPANFSDDYKDRIALQRQQISISRELDIRYDSKVPCDSCPVTPVNSWAPAEWKREIERLTPEERRVWDEAYQTRIRKFHSIKTNDQRIRFQYQSLMQDYLRCVQSVDDNVGRVLDYLDQQGLADNTVVIYMSDQGFYLGEHGLYDKRFMYEESFRTPMLIRYPKKVRSAQRNNSYVLNLDIAPTLLDWAGLKVPSDMQGVSMKTLLSGKQDRSWRKEIYYHYYERSFGLTPHYGIKTDRYKLIHFYGPIDSWELYDLKVDPAEMRNLANDPEYQQKVKDLRQRLNYWKKYYRDPVQY
ncbi:sulfatase [Niabella yanshanensis]|uniref:Sulfatase n=1 Tax=Niabella yanshanensis TaxID=577386 RepID=A0ABZ0W5U5_9BACT|nr:sulfatase [Niabella yanshanensis]WQD38673.1 sulfatase [Niabella yanshanensis]